jgi:hypothetical protein
LPSLSVEQPHLRAYTGLARLHKNHFLIAFRSRGAGPAPTPRIFPSPFTRL